jgi:XTP/dITP diphosphohydrolase
MPLVLLVSSPRVAPGLLSGPAWSALRAGPAFGLDPTSAGALALTSAGISLTWLDGDRPAELIAEDLLAATAATGTATLWIGADTGPRVSAIIECLSSAAAGEVETTQASWDLPGAHLLDVVATMDRLRSPGGCPWDAEQDHRSLAPYLLEEAYEAFQAIEDDDTHSLREELGDVLLQVVFHARVAQERSPDEAWSVDDVADALVAKLVRRHPHVFGDVAVGGVDEVNTNWETIKAAERGNASVLSNVPLSAPALTLAATLQRKAARAGLTVSDPSALPRFDDAVRDYRRTPSVETAGALLWALVEVMRADEVDPEAALRQRARDFRDQVGRQG